MVSIGDLPRRPLLTGRDHRVHDQRALNGVPDVEQLIFNHANGRVKPRKVKAFQ